MVCFARPETFFYLDPPYYGEENDNPTKVPAQEYFIFDSSSKMQQLIINTFLRQKSRAFFYPTEVAGDGEGATANLKGRETGNRGYSQGDT
jgi:hypothetical protein